MHDRFLHFTGRVGLAWVAAAVLFLPALAQEQKPEAAPKPSETPLSAEQLAVYRVVLHGWMENEVSGVNLAITTEPWREDGPFGAGDCGKGLDLEPVAPTLFHRFRPQDLPSLGSSHIVLVDPEQQRKEVAENDPRKGMEKGKSVDEAVRNGFAHGLVTLGEIRFDKSHKHAIVSYGFVCGGLCGNGGTAVLEKTESGWRRMKDCSNWIS
ncbi:MAG: hypothetical protein WCE75_16455 [Terracidiphilus sp.]